MAVKDNILKYLDLKGISKSEFYRKIDAGNGLLDKGKGINGDKIGDILRVFPDINPEWLLTGNGPMLKEQPQGGDGVNIGERNTIGNIVTNGSTINEAPQSSSDQERIQFLEEQVKFYREQAEFYREKAHHLDYTNRQATDKQPLSNE